MPQKLGQAEAGYAKTIEGMQDFFMRSMAIILTYLQTYFLLVGMEHTPKLVAPIQNNTTMAKLLKALNVHMHPQNFTNFVLFWCFLELLTSWQR